MRHGVLVTTSAGTYLTVEFDTRESAQEFHRRLHEEERIRVEMRVAADAVETVDLHAPGMLDDVQPIVTLSG